MEFGFSIDINRYISTFSKQTITNREYVSYNENTTSKIINFYQMGIFWKTKHNYNTFS